ncbi:hypothetical protein [Flavobacterium quisquiliarum]|uniref:Uncharacterized protein n=1 Tax=Flavobacterium quisquiliarum TaxID=1834436 RepID=A0ABV8W9N9_9FLAO|nr:hypothetical protein [Flavobacterium quisquiliarum]MBW1658164.1 hypothetical protein [Flavobacterium quisquiliarum]NWK99935.1 hypothetical protein [Flavobacterium collinsii]
MIGYFVFFVFVAIFAYVSVKWGTFLISDLIAGFILLVFFTHYHFRNDLDKKAGIMVFFVNLILYVLLFISSVFIYFDQENEKKTYWIFTILASFLLVMLEKMVLNFDDAFQGMYVPVALAFFPMYLLKYYIKYIRE